MKKCTKCGKAKAASAFYAAPGRVCKTCRCEQSRNYHARRPEVVERRRLKAVQLQQKREQQQFVCPHCRQTKNRTEFYRSNASRGFHSWCKVCCRAAGRKRVRDPKKRRQYTLKSRYGLSSADLTQLRLAQKNKCGLCAQPLQHNHFHIDHSHTTGEIRGLLCPRCNVAIGLFHDDPELIKAALCYLERKSWTVVSSA